MVALMPSLCCFIDGKKVKKVILVRIDVGFPFHMLVRIDVGPPFLYVGTEDLLQFQSRAQQHLHQQMPSYMGIWCDLACFFEIPASTRLPLLTSLLPSSLSFHHLSPSTISLLPPRLSFHRPWSLYFHLPTGLVYFSRYPQHTAMPMVY